VLLFEGGVTSPGAYTHYKLVVTACASNPVSISELVLLPPLIPLPIPALTANFDQGYGVLTSSTFSSNYEGYHLFDRSHGSLQAGWASSETAAPHFMVIFLPSAATVTSFRLWGTGGWDKKLPAAIQLDASNDGTNWTQMAVYTNMTFITITSVDKATNPVFQSDFDTDTKPGEYAKVFQGNITSPGSYNRYRLTITDVNDTFTSLSEFVLL